jgi:hypothetical protein
MAPTTHPTAAGRTGCASFEAEARRQLLAEDEARFAVRVRDRARILAEKARQLAVTDFPIDPKEAQTRLDELVARHQALSATRPEFRSAADDDELRVLMQRIHELQKRCRLQGTLSRESA